MDPGFGSVLDEITPGPDGFQARRAQRGRRGAGPRVFCFGKVVETSINTDS